MKALEQHQIGASLGPAALMQAQAETEPGKFLSELNTSSVPAKTLVTPHEPAEVGAILFGKLAGMWECDYVERVVGGQPLLAASTKQKYRNHLHNHILPRWASTPLGGFRAKEVLDWLQEESGSWFMMTDLRNILSGIFTKAQEWELLPDTFANPIARVKLPKKWQVYERRILSEEETVHVLARLQDPHRLICEPGHRSPNFGSHWPADQARRFRERLYPHRAAGRHWRGDIDRPKTERSKRTLTLGTLAGRLQHWMESLKDHRPEAWVFPHSLKAPPLF